MAEATDRPQAEPEEAPGRTAPAVSETYQPLSLLALAGFAMGVLYAATVVIGGAVALFNRSPWLLPVWTFLFPLAALIVCWLARARIRDSEATLSGLTFTTWGVRLTILTGLIYTAYYAFTFIAVRLQAIDCADRFFAQLQQGNLERAFLLAMGEPIRDVEDSEVRDEVQSRFNRAMGSAGGAYDLFQRTSFVRAIQMAGNQANITSAGVTDWGYGQGGYRVVLKYHVVTPEVEFDLNVETFGQDSPPGESRGRLWHVALSKGETNLIPSTLKLTARGKEAMNEAQMAWNLAAAWQERVNRLAWQDAYLDTLDPSQRERLLQGRRAVLLRTTAPLAGPSALGLYGQAGRDFLESHDKLTGTKLFRIDDKRFWSSKQQRASIVERIHKTFQLGSGGAPTFSLRVQQAEIPRLQQEDGRVIARFDARLTYVDESTMQPLYVVEGELLVSAPADEAGSSSTVWKVDAIEATTGRTPPQTERPGPAGAPGMAGPPARR